MKADITFEEYAEYAAVAAALHGAVKAPAVPYAPLHDKRAAWWGSYEFKDVQAVAFTYVPEHLLSMLVDAMFGDNLHLRVVFYTYFNNKLNKLFKLYTATY